VALLKKLPLVARRRIPRELIRNVHVHEDILNATAAELVVAVEACVFGEKTAELRHTVIFDAPKGRWAMFLWAITPSRWRPWLRRRLPIGSWSQTVGFDQYRVFPQYVPASHQFGSDTVEVMVPVMMGPYWHG
jgi:hypothetical protein